ncbi:acyloxyacyl hydrolase [Bacteroides sp. GM023]|uniref:acyloxyacyl hydrolase n=1 Tax=Bacteroides sp. GM023 TaxID=2723058 RepID=UPI00168AD35C|nr:acyloxyacyl hydrolase [Bacteroides sp. GM023]MBD3590795.1 acyloxyacyl hydrolase [Bacteroides sp. GM023]
MTKNVKVKQLLYVIYLLVLLTVGGKLKAQIVEKHRIGLDIRPGYVVPTNSFLEGDNLQQKIIEQSLSLHLKYAFQFSKDSNLGRMYPHAYQGIGVSYNTFYCPAELGNPVTVYAFQGAPIVRLSSRLSFDYEWNFGASFGWKKYDEQYNPQNEVIGSKINAYINLGFLLNWQFHPQWKLAAGVDFTHFSNGNTHYPNGGLNIIGGRVGIVRTFGDTDNTSEGRVPKRLFIKPHVSYDLVLYGATRKRGFVKDNVPSLVPGSFGIAGLNFAPMYNFNNYFRAGLSMDAQYDESANIKDYKLEGSYSDDLKFHRPPFREQFAVGLSLRAELVMPIFSINAGFGRNLIGSGEDTKGFYQILALKTYVTRHLFLHVGYQLREFKDPNNLMLGIGYRFHDKR